MVACYRSLNIDHYFLIDFESKIVKGTDTFIYSGKKNGLFGSGKSESEQLMSFANSIPRCLIAYEFLKASV